MSTVRERERAGSWNRFLQLFGHFVQFSYACWDRIMPRGYYPRLQRPENIVQFFRDVCGDARIIPAVLARHTSSYRRWLESFTEQRWIPLLTAPKGVHKEEVVAPYLLRTDRTDLTEAEVWKLYVLLTRIERSFR